MKSSIEDASSALKYSFYYLQYAFQSTLQIKVQIKQQSYEALLYILFYKPYKRLHKNLKTIIFMKFDLFSKCIVQDIVFLPHAFFNTNSIL